ncbi:MAG: PAS domain S-box protein [Opitutaceae bacterium]|nr:PAS domain S-box protein [Opitutaceae bacterium]
MGIGASAGGLEAFTQLLKRLPADTGLGFVLVQHLDPQHASALTQLLARATAMPVRDVTDKLRVKPNHVYVIPPNTGLGLTRGVLKLLPRTPGRAAPRSIDFFFEALAKDVGERAIGVILSGTATDGTLGLEAIKAAGGLTFAQDASAKYDSMPRSAVAAGCVDFVLAPAAIARELARIARHPLVAGETAAPAETPPATLAAGPARPGGHERIFALLRAHTGVDFSLYKPSTIHRRIARRMLLTRHATLARYAAYLSKHPAELDALYSDTLIGVTGFFRNAEAFAVLQRKVFPRLLRQGGTDPLRVWVLGCSTGQEAYSIAMTFAESAKKIPHPRQLQVFATDLNDASLDKARHGLYAKTLVQDVSPDRLRRYFTEEEGGYRVIKPLRELVVFARQNLIGDPPFSRMDLISCRNLMIYLEPSLQRKVLPTFHYALKPGGFLFLGASESIGGFTELFAPVDKKQKLFVKKTAPTLAFHLPVKTAPGTRTPAGKNLRAPALPPPKAGTAADAFRGELNAEREADRVTVNQFAPPGVLIDASLQILQFRGSTGPYLEPPTGKASFDLLKMARAGLMLPLRATIARAQKEDRTARTDNVRATHDGESRRVHLVVVPLKNLKERCFLVLFEDADRTAHPAARAPLREPPAASRREETARIAELERELAESRDYLQSIREQQETATEELQASCEEGQSANEELQSLNEELETSKEELESTNEELTTVNDEMVSRNTELNRLNADLTNLHASTKLAVVLLGRDRTVRRFSAPAEKKFNLAPADVGRPIGQIRHTLDLTDLDALAAAVIAGGRECEREVRDRDGRWFLLRVRPYLTAERKIDGAVIVLMDINAVKESQQAVAHARDFAEAILGSVREPFLILDGELRVRRVNAAFHAAFRTTSAQVEGRDFFALGDGHWENPRLRALLRAVLPRRRPFHDFEITVTLRPGGRRTLLLDARTLLQGPGHREKILLGLRDVTEMQEAQADLARSEKRYRRLFEAAKDGILILDPATRKITDANPYILNFLGYTRKQLLQKELWQIGLLKDEAASRQAFLELNKNGFIRYEDLPLKTKKGQQREVEFVSNRYRENGHDVIQCNIRDITERKRTEAALLESQGRYRTLFNSIDEGFCLIEVLFDKSSRPRDYRFLEVNPSFAHQTGLRNAVGKRMRQLAPRHEAHWYQAYGRVALTGKPERFINEAKALDSWFDVYAFRLGGNESRKIAVLFSNITERKLTEDALTAARSELSRHAAQLESVVAVRTAELTATNTQLEASIASIRAGREQYRALLQESEFMQKKLRHLTRQFLTAQEDERRAISRELHDDVVQTLVGISVELAALGSAASLGLRAVKAKIVRTQRLVEKSITAVHRFARDLRPAVLDDLGLIPALHAYLKQIAARKKIQIHLTSFAGVEALDSARRTVLYRVAQEALNNVVRHAGATAVTITIAEIPDAIRMEVRDNGKSFQVPQALNARTNKRLGLLGMRERVEMIGGTLIIESSPGQGTTVRADVPSPPPPAK